jgi:hypothetical protein
MNRITRRTSYGWYLNDVPDEGRPVTTWSQYNSYLQPRYWLPFNETPTELVLIFESLGVVAWEYADYRSTHAEVQAVLDQLEP